MNWEEKQIIAGECKWGIHAVSQEVVRDLREVKGPSLLQALPEEGAGWQVHYALFSRAGFTLAAQALAKQHRITLVDLDRVDHDLSEVKR